MNIDELKALLFLTHIPLLGSIKIRLLIQHFGTAQTAALASSKEIAHLPGFGPKILQYWELAKKSDEHLRTLALAEKHNIHIFPYTHPSYPQSLLKIPDFPILLYIKGTLKEQDKNNLAIVGTRNASIYGQEMARKISEKLAFSGFTIISGLARGIDTAAHEAALVGGRTIAVLGSGFGHIYPKENEKLAEQISEQGALISEFPMMTPPDRQHFPQRNRIVSGMSLGVILIEGPKHSGAMITMEQAINIKKPTFALPGRVDNENFSGNHDLIKKRQAQLIENAEDVIIYYSDLLAPAAFKLPTQYTFLLEKEEEDFIRQLPAHELSIEDIVLRTKLPIPKVNVLLMSLVLKKVIKEFPGKIYKKI